MGAPPISLLLQHAGPFMSTGERAALEGILATLRPSLSIEVGTWTGGSLERVSAHSEEVHAFDLKRHPDLTPERFPNVTFHVGDSHELLPAVLRKFAATGRNVDFALVDGDHSAGGARQDLEDLLSSASVGESVIVLHDTLNGRVRHGLDQVSFGAYDKVKFVDLDFVPGRVMREGPQQDDLWYGLGLVVTSSEPGDVTWPRAYPVPDVYDAFAASLVDGEHGRAPLGHEQLIELERDVELRKDLLRRMERSWSWRLTAPLRYAKHVVQRMTRH